MDTSKAIKYLQLAEFQAQLFSKDESTKVAALVLDNNQNIRSTGFNGLPRGFEETTERWSKPTKYDYVVHAEANAICSAARNGATLAGCTLFSTLFPCNECAKLIIQAGIKRIVYSEEYRKTDSFKLFEEAGIEIKKIEI